LRGMSSDADDLDEERRRRLALPRVIKAKDLPWEGGPGHWNKDVLRPSMEPFRTQTLEIHIESEAPGGISHNHGHQNEALFYVLEGHGYELHEGERHDSWAGDVAMVPYESSKQQCNAGDGRRIRAHDVKPSA